VINDDGSNWSRSMATPASMPTKDFVMEFSRWWALAVMPLK
jgi:hypothetical protein